jgi:hypothetical protein
MNDSLSQFVCSLESETHFRYLKFNYFLIKLKNFNLFSIKSFQKIISLNPARTLVFKVFMK